MIRKTTCVLIAIVGGVLLGGCNLGMQPTGASVEEINAIRAKWPPEKQIQGIMQSPMPADQKKKKVAEIREKYHLPADNPKPATDKAPGRGATPK